VKTALYRRCHLKREIIIIIVLFCASSIRKRNMNKKKKQKQGFCKAATKWLLFAKTLLEIAEKIAGLIPRSSSLLKINFYDYSQYNNYQRRCESNRLDIRN
jgi:hypothetical protein